MKPSKENSPDPTPAPIVQEGMRLSQYWRALPLGVAAERSVHYYWCSFSFTYPPRFLRHILFSNKGFLNIIMSILIKVREFQKDPKIFHSCFNLKLLESVERSSVWIVSKDCKQQRFEFTKQVLFCCLIFF